MYPLSTGTLAAFCLCRGLLRYLRFKTPCTLPRWLSSPVRGNTIKLERPSRMVSCRSWKLAGSHRHWPWRLLRNFFPSIPGYHFSTSLPLWLAPILMLILRRRGLLYWGRRWGFFLLLELVIRFVLCWLAFLLALRWSRWGTNADRQGRCLFKARLLGFGMDLGLWKCRIVFASYCC